MQRNLDYPSVWRRGHVRLGIVLIATCLIVVLALVIKLRILPNHSEREGGEAWNNKTTRVNESNGTATTTITTHSSTQITTAVKGNESNASTTSSSTRWIVDAPLIRQRGGLAAVVMDNGDILVSGGLVSMDSHSFELSASEIYSSRDRKWRAAADMQVERGSHTLTLLQNRKSILAIGSLNDIDSYTAEIYDIETDRWTFVSSIMEAGRLHHTATLLQNEQVLIVGGITKYPFATTHSVQLYDPSLNTFINTGTLNMARWGHTATLLNDRLSVLVTGGASITYYRIATAEVYMAGSWSYTTGNMVVARNSHAAVLLLNGNVLVAGGSGINNEALSFVEIYDPKTRLFLLTQPMAYARAELTLTLLPSGQVLAAGGSGSTTGECPLASELYDPTTEQWITTQLLNTVHYDHATVLVNNSVLVIGGYDNIHTPLDQCERYDL